MKSCDFTNSGSSDLLVSRDDGALELWAFDINNELEPIYQQNLKEGVTEIDYGCLSYPGVNEFLTSTYSGKIVSYMDSEVRDKFTVQSAREKPKETQKRIMALKAEIDKYEQ